MADTHDTIDGLLAEFRGYSHGMPPSYHVTMSWADFRKMLTRFEAAHKREKAAIEADALSAGGLVEAMRQKKAICTKCRDGEPPKNCQFFGEPDGCSSPTYGHYPQLPIGDRAKLREALVQVQKKINYLIGNLTVPNSLVANRMEINGIINAALAAPPRNCDVYNNESCRMAYHLHGDGLMTMQAFADWLFAPATEQEGGAP